MKNKITSVIVVALTVASSVVWLSSIARVQKLQAEVISLEKKLADTEGANEVLVEQLKQIIGGR